jgi:hypothetical protein
MVADLVNTYPYGTVTCSATGTSQTFSGTLVNGSTTWRLTDLPIGTYSLTCNYAGNIDYLASTSPTVQQQIVAMPQPIWTSSGPLPTGVVWDTATLLASGSVLIAGGSTNGADQGAVNTAYLYTAGNGFTATGSMYANRFYHSASLLSNGMVLVAGGENSNSGILSATELYNSSSTVQTFSPGPNLNYPRTQHTATTLNDGTVLIAGGMTGGIGQGEWAIGQAEVYTPSTSGSDNGAFTVVGGLNTPRWDDTATLLSSGMVLIVGGIDNNNEIIGTAELYNPATGQFTYTGSLNTPRGLHTAMLLPNGMVLIAGGVQEDGTPLASAEIYDPTQGIFSYTGSLNTARLGHAAVLLNTGNVLIFGGGVGTSHTATTSSEMYVYDASAGGSFTSTASLNTARYFPTVTAMQDGTVLTTGAFVGAETYSDASKITGILNPKYVVIGLTYAPPGPSSYVSYQNSVYVGITNTIANSYSTGQQMKVAVSSSGGVPGWLGGATGTVTGTSITGFTQTNTYSDAVTVTGQVSNNWKTFGTPDAFAPVNHDYDIIWVWLNPLLVLTADATQPDALPVWNGYAYNMDDSANGGPQGMDIWPVAVGCLNGDFNTSECSETYNKLARTWAAVNEYYPNGGGPALTQADYTQILTYDPFTNPSYQISLDSSNPATTLDGRYTQATTVPAGSTSVGSPENIPYPIAPPGVGPISDTYLTTYSSSTQDSHTAQSQTTQSFGIENKFSGSFFIASVTYDLSQTFTLTWTNTAATTITNTQTQTDTAYISGPPCGSPYCTPSYSGIAPSQPANFDVFQDNLFGTFMFYGTN